MHSVSLVFLENSFIALCLVYLCAFKNREENLGIIGNKPFVYTCQNPWIVLLFPLLGRLLSCIDP